MFVTYTIHGHWIVTWYLGRAEHQQKTPLLERRKLPRRNPVSTFENKYFIASRGTYALNELRGVVEE